MKNTKQSNDIESRELSADAYASKIKSDIWKKIVEGFECKTIADFYKECSPKEQAEVTQWNHAVFGKALCDEVDQAIDIALSVEETEMSNVAWIVMIESANKPGKFSAELILEDQDHKKTKQRREMTCNSFHCF